MSTSQLQKNYQPPIARGVIATFNTIINDIHKISVISVLERFHPQITMKTPFVFEQALELFSKITKDSTTKDCFEFTEFVKSITSEEIEYMTLFDKETVMTDFYNNFRKLRDLIEHKLSVPLQLWKKTKQDAMHFPEIYGRLLVELCEVREAVEKARLLKDKVMPEQAAEGEKKRKKISASEDFKSLHPFFLIANSEEHMENVSEFKQKKVQSLEAEQKIAEEKLKKATVKFRKEIQSIIQETIKTKSFIEWLEEKNHSKQKEFELKGKDLWNNFINEMEKSSDLSKTYFEKHAIYLEIEREKADRKLLKQQEAAASVLQMHWRRYIARKSLKEDEIPIS